MCMKCLGFQNRKWCAIQAKIHSMQIHTVAAHTRNLNQHMQSRLHFVIKIFWSLLFNTNRNGSNRVIYSLVELIQWTILHGSRFHSTPLIANVLRMVREMCRINEWLMSSHTMSLANCVSGKSQLMSKPCRMDLIEWPHFDICLLVGWIHSSTLNPRTYVNQNKIVWSTLSPRSLFGKGGKIWMPSK